MSCRSVGETHSRVDADLRDLQVAQRREGCAKTVDVDTFHQTDVLPGVFSDTRKEDLIGAR